MEKVASRQFYYFYISIFNETPKQTQTNYYWVLKEEQRIVNLLQQGFLCVFPLAVLFGKGFSCGGMKYSVEYYFRGKHLVSGKIRGLWVKYAVALFQISPSILFGVHSTLPNSKSLHSSLWTVAKGTLSLWNRIFKSFFGFLDGNLCVLRVQLFPALWL